MDDGSRERQRMTAGLDLGDKYSYLSVFWTPTAARSSKRVVCVPLPRPSGDALTLSGRSTHIPHPQASTIGIICSCLQPVFALLGLYLGDRGVL